MEARICFLTGPCGAGKSTVGTLLAKDEHFEKAMFVEIDAFRRMVWRGYVPPFPETDASRDQLRLAAIAAAKTAKTYHDKGFCVFVEEILEPWLVSVYEKELEGCETKTICLMPQKEELQKRDRSRTESEQMGDRCLELWQSFSNWSSSSNWTVVDSSKQTAAETAKKIIELLS